MEVLAAIFFVLALFFTLIISRIQKLFPRFHLEVELVFPFFAVFYFGIFCLRNGLQEGIAHFSDLHFQEPIFVFFIVLMSSVQPLLILAERGLQKLGSVLSQRTRWDLKLSELLCLLTLGPLLGSLITEPAAITISALMVKKMFPSASKKFMYSLLATLFVNISVGGALTAFAAPPILMVARPWGWSSLFVFKNFGWKAILILIMNSGWIVFRFRNEILKYARHLSAGHENEKLSNWKVIVFHVLSLVLLILFSHQTIHSIFVFLIFLAGYYYWKKNQKNLKWKESFLVGFFLAGVVLLGSFQSWWIEPLFQQTTSFTLYLGASILTGFVDNAALTYLGTLVPHLSLHDQYFLVAGSLVGGGLTLIANAPNMVGFSLLAEKFEGGFESSLLFIYALVPTLLAFLIFYMV